MRLSCEGSSDRDRDRRRDRDLETRGPEKLEKTIGLCRTASEVDISDGISAFIVLEHSPKSYQNILKQAPSNVRASYSAMRGWLREYAKTLRRYDGTSGSSAHQTTGHVPMDVDQTRAVSGFS